LSFIVFVIKGNYTNITPKGREYLPQWSIRYRPALHKHTVETKGCWTLVLAGREKREWGFYLFNKSGKEIWFKAKRYFLKMGHHPCQ
jgi:hypothetical protein